MKHINLDTLPEPVRQFFRGVAANPEGSVIELDGKAVVRVTPMQVSANGPEFTAYRARWIRIVTLAQVYDPDLYRELMGFPNDLPDLRALRPPDGNTRPEGIEQSHFHRRQRGELSATY